MSMEPESPSLREAKAHLRRVMREKLCALNHAEQAEASLVICREAAVLPEFREARCVGLFASLATEPDLHPLVEEAWAERKKVALPLMIQTGKETLLDWREVKSWDELVVPGPFGLREPDPEKCPRVEGGALDLVFVPGMAFDRTGVRLGRGGGFYDRFLAGMPKKCQAIGMMFACQEAASVPCESHDRPLPSVLSEDGLQVFKRPSS